MSFLGSSSWLLWPIVYFFAILLKVTFAFNSCQVTYFGSRYLFTPMLLSSALVKQSRSQKTYKAHFLLSGLWSSSLMALEELVLCIGLINFLICFWHLSHPSSQYCSRLAASGRVVIAIEHREGSGPSCMPRSWNREGRSEPRTLFYLREDDIQ